MRTLTRYTQRFSPGFVLLTLLLVWETSVALWRIPAWLLPSPSAIAAVLGAQAPLLLHHTLWTVGEAVIGLAAAVLLASLLATLMDIAPRVKSTLYPLLALTQAIPILALAPLLLIWLGYGVQTKVVVVILVCFFPLVTNLSDGLAITSAPFLGLFNNLGATRFQLYRLLKLPAALPYFFSGLRVATTYAMIGAILAEWLGAEYGLGIYLLRSAKSFATAQVFAASAVIAFVTLVLLAGVGLLARYALPTPILNGKVHR